MIKVIGACGKCGEYFYDNETYDCNCKMKELENPFNYRNNNKTEISGVEVHGYYILKDKKALPVDDLIEWATKLESQNRKVAEDIINGIRISTVFLGLDHQFGDGEPLIFETMVFGGELDQEQNRYSTWEEAEAGHKAIVKRIKQNYYPFKRKITTKQLKKIIKLMRES